MHTSSPRRRALEVIARESEALLRTASEVHAGALAKPRCKPAVAKQLISEFYSAMGNFQHTTVWENGRIALEQINVAAGSPTNSATRRIYSYALNVRELLWPRDQGPALFSAGTIPQSLLTRAAKNLYSRGFEAIDKPDRMVVLAEMSAEVCKALARVGEIESHQANQVKETERLFNPMPQPATTDALKAAANREKIERAKDYYRELFAREPARARAKLESLIKGTRSVAMAALGELADEGLYMGRQRQPRTSKRRI